MVIKEQKRNETKSFCNAHWFRYPRFWQKFENRVKRDLVPKIHTVAFKLILLRIRVALA